MNWIFSPHIDCVYVNPRRHGLVKRAGDFPYSTFHRYVDAGIDAVDWYLDVEGK